MATPSTRAQAAVWCCSGWQTGSPRFSRLVREGNRIFAEALTSDEQKLLFQRELLRLLWERRDNTMRLHVWLQDIQNAIVIGLISESRILDDEGEILSAFIEHTVAGGAAEEMTLGQFSGHGEGNDRINLSTLHSAKGREFGLVIMFAMDNGRIPWSCASL